MSHLIRYMHTFAQGVDELSFWTLWLLCQPTTWVVVLLAAWWLLASRKSKRNNNPKTKNNKYYGKF